MTDPLAEKAQTEITRTFYGWRGYAKGIQKGQAAASGSLREQYPTPLSESPG